MNVVPVTQQSQDEQQKRNQQQACRLGRIGGVAVVLVRVFVRRIGHAAIVAPARKLTCMKAPHSSSACVGNLTFSD